jgi:hypothetical protein
MNRNKAFLSLLFCVFSLYTIAQQTAKSTFHQWAPTPPMGWNSWDCFGPTVVESEVKANADYMAKNLKQYGWEYIVVDIRWYVGNDKAHGYNETNPDYVMDEYGRFQPAVNRFPSAANGKGFKPLADYIHSKGLKFGIHIMRGIPVIAVKQNTKIKGSSARAQDIYSEKDQCRWLRDMYTVVPGKPGAQEYYNSLFELYASWGLDFIKIDDLSSPIYFTGEIEMIRKAIDRTGRKILLSTSPGETPIDHAKHVQNNANMWRTVGDFWDSWQQLKEHFDVFKRWNQYRAPGAWPDGDMLPLGHIGIRAERGNDRMSAFTKDEQRTLMTLWSIFKSPLMFGGDLPGNDAFTLSLLTNKAVLDVLKYSTGNRELFRTKENAGWIANDPKTGDKYLALFNIADQVEAEEEKAIWKSDIINRNTQTLLPIDVDLNGSTKLYLAVTDAGDGNDWDHANWISPMIYSDTDSMQLTSIKWTKARAGWGRPQINKSVAGNPLTTTGKIFANGIGTHSNSLLEFDIPKGYTRFKASVGLDKNGTDQNSGSSVRFMIFNQNPSGPMPASEAKITIPMSDLGLKSASVKVTDLWTGKSLGFAKKEISATIPKHGAVLYRISLTK